MREEERRDAEHRASPTGRVVYEAICAEGRSELERRSPALAWSGLAAGLSMSLSLVASSLLHAHTPQAEWQPLVTSLGYSLGFIVVVLGRQQLFTENTLTVVLPFLAKRSASTLKGIARLWAVVLLSNLAGALIAAAVLANSALLAEETWEAMLATARHVYEASFRVTLLRGIVAGWIIASMIWLLPFAESARVTVIWILTYVVGLGHFSHVIAGAVDAGFLVFAGESSWADFALRFFVPALLGNVIGGVLLVAAINHAQVNAGGAEDDA